MFVAGIGEQDGQKVYRETINLMVNPKGLDSWKLLVFQGHVLEAFSNVLSMEEGRSCAHVDPKPYTSADPEQCTSGSPFCSLV